MSKIKTSYSCHACGSSFSKWAGQCSECGAWNSIHEVKADTSLSPRQRGNYAGQASTVTILDQVSIDAIDRTHTGLSELDRVLGGG
ncbi:MAG TPA: DNA repair protein RadA, partial [Agitococcus sp.]|nr:DNA repair protein RadA [Agitococcus sp.]